ncbi:MAG: HAMP domain-containing histidine kinase [Moorea sp. SIO2B7]|nr:HAMP domain-containing histidine kinase [Moorena sp. SIO2B7]
MNSIKYAKNDPKLFRVEVEVVDKPHQIFIRFKDWGIGIKSENRDKIFEEGFRTPEALKKNVVGSGLGLFISKGIIRELGGKLELISPVYKPTEFQITLPKNKSLKEEFKE